MYVAAEKRAAAAAVLTNRLGSSINRRTSCLYAHGGGAGGVASAKAIFPALARRGGSYARHPVLVLFIRASMKRKTALMQIREGFVTVHRGFAADVWPGGAFADNAPPRPAFRANRTARHAVALQSELDRLTWSPDMLKDLVSR